VGDRRLVDDAPAATRISELEELLAQKECQLASAPVIEQAKGTLMRDLGVDPDHAFNYLVTLSQHTNIKLRAVAEHVITELTDAGVNLARAEATRDILNALRTHLRGL
jgi:hypothetical protein